MSSPAQPGREPSLTWYDGLLRTILLYAKEHAELTDKTGRVPPAPRGELKVIGAGMSRTGTLSLHAAFTVLGLKSYHGMELQIHETAQKWKRVLEQERKTGSVDDIDWVDVVAGYNAGCDMPFGDFYKELADAFPDAKVVLTYRDKDVWWRSVTEALLEPLIDSRLHGLAMLWFPKFHLVWVVSRLAFTRYRRQPGGFGPQTHEQRVEEVKRTIAPERLLVYRVQEGWEPLCKFLNLPIPDEPFPRVNDADIMRYIIHGMTAVGLSLWAGAASAALGIGYYLYQRVAM